MLASGQSLFDNFSFIESTCFLNIYLHVANSKQQSVIQQLHARKGRLIVMCSEGDATSVCPMGSCRVIEVPQVADCLQPVINIIPMQVCLWVKSYIFLV